MTTKLLECEHLIKLFGLDYLINKASRISLGVGESLSAMGWESLGTSVYFIQ